MKLSKRVYLLASLAFVLAVLYLGMGHRPRPGTLEVPVPFPSKVDNVTAVRALVGEEGLEAIKSIHWDPEALVGLVNGSVVMYSDGSVLWIAAMTNSSLAKSLEEKMVRRIAQLQGELPYGVPIPHKVGNTTFYIIPDVRQRVHVLWREGRYLIWLQLGSEGIKIFKELVNMYAQKR